MSTYPSAESSTSLDNLAATVRAAHQAVGLAARNVLEHAMHAGDALIAAKKGVPHRAWLDWLNRQCDLGERQAQRYMALAAARATLESNPTRVSDLSLRAALLGLSPAIAAVPASFCGGISSCDCTSRRSKNDLCRNANVLVCYTLGYRIAPG
jgi:Protein of unknown function (DUF3102)